MIELGLPAPDSPQGDRPTDGTATSGSAIERVRRKYVAPAILEFGSVQEFTRGSGSSTLDSRRTTRQLSRG
jgi:hypothetical protein